MKRRVLIGLIAFIVVFVSSCTQYRVMPPWMLPGFDNEKPVEYVTVTLDYDNGNISTEKIQKGAAFVIPGIGDETVDGKSFTFWTDDDGSEFYAGDKVVVSENLNLTASWVSSEIAVVIGSTKYDDLGAAFKEAGDNSVVVLTKDAESTALQTDSTTTKNMTIVLNGNTLTVTKPLAGSAGTQNQALQNLKGNTVTIKNGEIALDAENARMVFQNYGNLILDNVKVTVTDSSVEILSINAGTVVLRNGTVLDGSACTTAADIFYWPTAGYTEGATLIIEDNDSRIIGPFGYSNDYDYAEEKYEGKTQADLYDDFISNTKVLIPSDYPYDLNMISNEYFDYVTVDDSDNPGYSRILPILK